MNARTAAVGVGALVLALIFGLLFFTSMVEEEARTACPTIGGSGSPALFVDPASIPVDEIAGYGREQLVNAAYIMAAGRDLGLSARDQTIGVMTAMGESGLRVLDHGDAVGPDSRGLFQQRDNGAWGTLEDRMDPYRSATNFFAALMAITDRAQLEPTLVANRVQRNADPYHYRTYWPAAQAVTAGLGGVTPASAIPAVATGGSYNLGPVQPQLAHLVDVLAPMFSVTTVGGWRASATDMAGHPAGLAADFMVPLNAAGQAQGDALAAYAQGHAAELGIDYILWRQRIWSTVRAGEGWRPMEDRGSPTANHEDHVHINVLGNPGAATTPVTAGSADCTPTISGGWMAPVQGEVTSPYGPRVHPVTGQPSFHDGADYAAPCGTPIHAAHSGLVVAVTPSVAYGVLVTVDHGGGVLSSYGHMPTNSVTVRVGDSVATGQVIAAVGSEGYSTGCHVHFIVEVNGSTVDPVTYLANAAAASGLVVAQANLRVTLSPEQFSGDLGTIAVSRPDFLTLNEVGRRGLVDLAPPGYAAWRDPAATGQQASTAIVWRTDTWQLLSSGRVQLIDQGPQRWDAGRSATWGIFTKSDGTRIGVVSVHQMINPGRYGPNKPERQRLYAEGMRRLRDLVQTMATPTLIGGDFNAQWADNDPWGPRQQLGAYGIQSTHDVLGPLRTHDGGGTIDYIFATPTLTPTSHRTTRLASDHYALIAEYR